VNERIRVPKIRVIGADGEQLGTMGPNEGTMRAQAVGLDLVEVAPLASPPVCRIMDFSKYKYDQEKKEKESRKRQHVVKLKEVRYKARIEEHDYQTKLSHIKEFVSKGNKVKLSLRFRGREMAHVEHGQAIMQRIITDVAPFAEVEASPTKQGRFLNMVLSPK